MKNEIRNILGVIEMVADADTAGGLVSANELPLDDARRLVRELTTVGCEASWAPSSRNEHSREQYAWLYLVEVSS